MMDLWNLIWSAPLLGFALGFGVVAMQNAWELWRTRHERRARDEELTRRINESQERWNRMIKEISRSNHD